MIVTFFKSIVVMFPICNTRVFRWRLSYMWHRRFSYL